jgi:transcriptional antiterminator RfaH
MAWYAVHTQPAAETKAAANLQRQGYATYLPSHRRLVRHARRKDVVRRPLFPRYLFVDVDRARKAWRPILSTLGVADLVRGGDEPVAVPERVVDAIRRNEGAGVFDQLAAAGDLRSGDAVRVVEGPFADCIGRLVEASGDERVCILFEIMGRPVRSWLPAGALEAV